jgi:hypothetical protein
MQRIPQSLLRNKSDIINMIEIVGEAPKDELHTSAQPSDVVIDDHDFKANEGLATHYWRGQQATGRVVRGEMGLGSILVCLVCLCTCFVLPPVFVTTLLCNNSALLASLRVEGRPASALR